MAKFLNRVVTDALCVLALARSGLRWPIRAGTAQAKRETGLAVYWLMDWAHEGNETSGLKFVPVVPLLKTRLDPLGVLQGVVQAAQRSGAAILQPQGIRQALTYFYKLDMMYARQIIAATLSMSFSCIDRP